jgi:hypothetical protein
MLQHSPSAGLLNLPLDLWLGIILPALDNSSLCNLRGVCVELNELVCASMILPSWFAIKSRPFELMVKVEKVVDALGNHVLQPIEVLTHQVFRICF